jgi:hypothetical protein
MDRLFRESAMRGSAATSGLPSGLVLAGLVGLGLLAASPTEGFAAGPGYGPGKSGHGSAYRGASVHGNWTSARRGSGLRWNIGQQPGQWGQADGRHKNWGKPGLRHPHFGWNRGIPLYVEGPLSAFAPTPGVPPGVQRLEVEWPDPVPTVLGIRRQPDADPVSYVVERGRVRAVVHAAPQVNSGPAVFERGRDGAWTKAVRGNGKVGQRMAVQRVAER